MVRRPCVSEDDTPRERRPFAGEKNTSPLLSRKRETNRGTSWSLDKVAAPRTSLAGSLYNFGVWYPLPPVALVVDDQNVGGGIFREHKRCKRKRGQNRGSWWESIVGIDQPRSVKAKRVRQDPQDPTLRSLLICKSPPPFSIDLAMRFTNGDNSPRVFCRFLLPLAI